MSEYDITIEFSNDIEREFDFEFSNIIVNNRISLDFGQINYEPNLNLTLSGLTDDTERYTYTGKISHQLFEKMLAGNIISNDEMNNGTITTNNLATGTITSNNLVTGTIGSVNTNNNVSLGTITLGGNPRIASTNSSFYSTYQPYQTFSHVPSFNPYVSTYSFGLMPETDQPSGSTNYSKI